MRCISFAQLSLFQFTVAAPISQMSLSLTYSFDILRCIGDGSKFKINWSIKVNSCLYLKAIIILHKYILMCYWVFRTVFIFFTLIFSNFLVLTRKYLKRKYITYKKYLCLLQIFTHSCNCFIMCGSYHNKFKSNEKIVIQFL